MSAHTSFQVGGPADLYTCPGTLYDLRTIYDLCLKQNIPWFVLGEGANILVADTGIRGVVIDMRGLRGFEFQDHLVIALSGTPLTEVVEASVERGMAGLEPFYTMPGSVGGSIWMNARCYGVSVSDVLCFVDVLDTDLKENRILIDRREFSYKRSPFQQTGGIILRGGFQIEKGIASSLRKKTEELKEDRIEKGHFIYPCAGSVFKNNSSFGMPSGKLIDSLGLRGMTLGGAAVSPKHANIIVNNGGATASDIRDLINHVKTKILERYGFELEEEILFVGQWDDSKKQQADDR
jgi:UDP-N-acetylmuramate dehydrogenase